MIPLPAPPAAAALSAAHAYAADAFAANIRRAYRADWTDFLAFCRAAGFALLLATPQAVAAYLAALAPSHASSAIARRLAAMGQAHRLARHAWTLSHPAIREAYRV